MPDDVFAEFHLKDEESTAALGRVLADIVSAGDTLLLSGPMGSGKTHLARALIQARLARAGWMEDVPSPTFTLVQTYDVGGVEIWHADLYRLNSPDEVIELGLSEAFETSIVLVEWPDRLGDLAPHDALRIELGVSGDGRVAKFASSNPEWRSRLPQEALADG